MELETTANASFVAFDGGVQQLSGEDTALILPFVLGAICAVGIGGNVLLLAVLTHNVKATGASDTAAMLVNLSATDLLLLALCAPARALTYRKRAWTLGPVACRMTEWLQHGCLAAKAFTLALLGRARHDLHSRVESDAHFKLKRTVMTAGAVWTTALAFPVADIVFSNLHVKGNVSLCVSELPPHSSEFVRVYGKVLPLAAYAVPVLLAGVCHVRAIFKSLPRAREASAARRGEIALSLLSVTAANALALLPEWGAWAWARHGAREGCGPPVALLVLAEVCMYLASALSPAILLSTLVPLRESLTSACVRVAGRRAVSNAKKHRGSSASEVRADAFDRTLPDLEHFWSGRQNPTVPDNTDPFPWERLEQGSAEL
ncbi:G-protein coupled receptor 151 [Pygocentrus nattereri]|uniref:G-protein coupled receptor 151 n=1 Tax=Pygocentrus nattereri TaxID=42514 RepID=UPI0008149085|nr:G-protein coupled receptor 151 [Pygocentrus nattereri]